MEYLVSLFNLIVVTNTDALDLDWWPIWEKYCSQYHPDTDSLDDPLTIDFNHRLFYDIHQAPFFSIRQHSAAELKSGQSWDQLLDMLSQLDFISLHKGFYPWYWKKFVLWLFEIWTVGL